MKLLVLERRDLRKVRAELRRMGRAMATATEQLTAVNAKLDDLAADVRAVLALVDSDTLSPEAQAKFDALSAKLATLDDEVGDRDGSDTPPVEEPPVEEPVPGEAPVTPPAERFID